MKLTPKWRQDSCTFWKLLQVLSGFPAYKRSNMTATFNVDAGGILQDIGGFGMYQKVLCVAVVGTINGLFAMSFATQLFSLVTSDHWCWNSDVEALEEQLPLAREDTKKFSIPVVSTGELRQEVVAIYMIHRCNF